MTAASGATRVRSTAAGGGVFALQLTSLRSVDSRGGRPYMSSVFTEIPSLRLKNGCAQDDSGIGSNARSISRSGRVFALQLTSLRSVDSRGGRPYMSSVFTEIPSLRLKNGCAQDDVPRQRQRQRAGVPAPHLRFGAAGNGASLRGQPRAAVPTHSFP
jgi:hypothetical protein